MKPTDLSGPWTLPEIEKYLGSTVIPIRISAVSESGWPVIVSLWFLYENGDLWCATRSSSKIARLLANHSRVAFEVAGETPPYYGVRGQGLASISEDENGVLLTRLVERYLGDDRPQFRQWLLKSSNDEVAIRITPTRMMSWDYRKRMAS